VFDHPPHLQTTRPASPARNTLLAALLASALVACDPDPKSAALQVRTDTTNQLHTAADVSRFLARAGLGATENDLATWQNRDAAEWLRAEFDKSPEPLMPQAVLDIEATGNGRPPFSDYTRYRLHRGLIESDAALRTKATYALSQILVVGGDVVDNGFEPFRGMAYHDALNRHAFGNYRDLLQDITYSAAMATWLTYLRNEPGDPNSGREPDENYARELLQLFTIGLHELNPDGTPILGNDGNPIPTYDNADVSQLARVFTGFSYDTDAYWSSSTENREAQARPLRIFADHHSTRSKQFLDTLLPAGLDGPTNVSMALDHIFSHRNVGPFISRQLIQRFTASHPEPDYVRRVAAAFDAGLYVSANETRFGTGIRGDLEATLAAVLLDASLFNDQHSAAAPTKVREPMLNYLHFMRAFEVENLEFLTRTHRIRDLKAGNALGMDYFRSPSVFGFYRPGYVPPMTTAGDQNLTVPEFQITNTNTVIGYIDLMTDLVLERPNTYTCPTSTGSNFLGLEPCNFAGTGVPFTPDYETELQLADSPQQLVSHLNTLLLGGRMPADEQQFLIDTLSGMPIETGSEAEDRSRRVHVAVLMFVTSPHYTILN